MIDPFGISRFVSELVVLLMFNYFFVFCFTAETQTSKNPVFENTTKKLSTFCIMNIILYPESSISFFIVCFFMLICLTSPFISISISIKIKYMHLYKLLICVLTDVPNSPFDLKEKKYTGKTPLEFQHRRI